MGCGPLEGRWVRNRQEAHVHSNDSCSLGNRFIGDGYGAKSKCDFARKAKGHATEISGETNGEKIEGFGVTGPETTTHFNCL